jgi:outer membrane protein
MPTGTLPRDCAQESGIPFPVVQPAAIFNRRRCFFTATLQIGILSLAAAVASAQAPTGPQPGPAAPGGAIPPAAAPAPSGAVPVPPVPAPAVPAAVPPAPTGAAAVPPTLTPVSTRPITLQEAEDIALRTHGNIAVAQQSVAAAQQRIAEARTGNLPSVQGNLGYAGSGTSNLGGLFGPSTRFQGNNVQFDQGLQPQLALNYNVYDGGLTRNAVGQARANEQSSEANLLATRNDLKLTVATNYIAELRAHSQLLLAQQEEILAQNQLNEVQARVAAGAAATADSALPLSALRNNQVATLTAQNQLRIAENTLLNSMGLPVGTPLLIQDLPDDTAPVPAVAPLQAAAVVQRPEIAGTAAQLRSAQAGVSIARINELPRASTVVGANLDPNDAAQRSSWTIGVGVSLPIFDAGLTRAREKEAQTQVASQEANLLQTRKDVGADVQDAYLNLVSARERLDASRLAVQAAQTNLDATTARYNLGLAGSDVVALVQAQVQFFTASTNEIQARYDVHLARAQLQKATGAP